MHIVIIRILKLSYIQFSIKSYTGFIMQSNERIQLVDRSKEDSTYNANSGKNNIVIIIHAYVQ